jgi:hypothetical protein
VQSLFDDERRRPGIAARGCPGVVGTSQRGVIPFGSQCGCFVVA